MTDSGLSPERSITSAAAGVGKAVKTQPYALAKSALYLQLRAVNSYPESANDAVTDNSVRDSRTIVSLASRLQIYQRRGAEFSWAAVVGRRGAHGT